MMAPSGGFSPAGSSGGKGVSGFMFQRTRIAFCGFNKAVSLFTLICLSGLILSKIQKLRP